MNRGAHDYFDLAGDPPIYRGPEPVKDRGYLTDRLTDEAVSFIKRHKDRPFYLHLAYNVVHYPKQAPPETIEQVKRDFPGLGEDRAILMAMLRHLDDGIGRIVETLKAEAEWDGTLLFFLTDNGGAKNMQANNAPLRGFKGGFYEGGIRTPFVVSWPAKFEGGGTIDTPVISLDILPTALDAAGLGAPADKPFDGKSLLPLLTRRTTAHHDALYWTADAETGEWAVRRGDWKLHGAKDRHELFDLATDPAEKANLAARNPDRAAELVALYDAWVETLAEPASGKPKRWGAEPKASTPRDDARQKRRVDRKRERDAEKKAARAAAPATPNGDAE